MRVKFFSSTSKMCQPLLTISVDSLIIAELFIYIEEKYDINIEQDFILSDSLSINSIANLIFEKV